jgi:hypothetical protein
MDVVRIFGTSIFEPKERRGFDKREKLVEVSQDSGDRVCLPNGIRKAFDKGYVDVPRSLRLKQRLMLDQAGVGLSAAVGFEHGLGLKGRLNLAGVIRDIHGKETRTQLSAKATG